MSRIATLWDRVKATRLWGVWQTYSGAQANLLAGGVGYFAFFSVFPAVLLAFTVFGYVLRDRPELLEQVKDGINQALPGFVQTQANPDGIISVEPPSTASLSVSGVVSVLGLVYTGTGWLSALRTAFQIILDVPATATNFVVGKGRDLAVLALLGVAFVVSAVLSAVAGSTARALADLIGLGQISWLLSGLSLVLSVVLDASIVALMLRLLPGARLPWSRLRGAALVGGLGLTALKRLGTLLLSGTLRSTPRSRWSLDCSCGSTSCLASSSWPPPGPPTTHTPRRCRVGSPPRRRARMPRRPIRRQLGRSRTPPTQWLCSRSRHRLGSTRGVPVTNSATWTASASWPGPSWGRRWRCARTHCVV